MSRLTDSSSIKALRWEKKDSKGEIYREIQKERDRKRETERKRQKDTKRTRQKEKQRV